MNTEFDSLTPELIQQRHQIHTLCQQFSRSPSKGNLNRLKKCFSSCGDSVFIESGFYCDYGDKISLGHRVYININCTFLDGGLITIGNDCLIGPNVQILTINHAVSPEARLDKANFTSPVTIEDNVWIVAGAIILPGVSIGKGAVIGAGSVVTKDVPSNTLFAGNPARYIRDID